MKGRVDGLVYRAFISVLHRPRVLPSCIVHGRAAMSDLLVVSYRPRDVVQPLVRRHAQDAAFYWQQIQTALEPPGLDLARWRHFHQLLEAHLDGLRVARERGVELALEALGRWRKPGETFVAAFAAGTIGEDAHWTPIWRACERDAGLLQAVTEAVDHWPIQDAQRWRRRWTQDDAPWPALAAVLMSAARLPNPLATLSEAPLLPWLTHPASWVRAAACRYVARASDRDATALSARLTDEAAYVRAEAAITLGTSDASLETPAVLWAAVSEQCATPSALPAPIIHRWVRHLGWMARVGHPEIPAVFDHLPPALALRFALHHGDPALMPKILQAMRGPEAALAGWVWQAMTGVDLAQEGLLLDQEDDEGHPLPDADAVAARTRALDLTPGQRMLLGHPWDISRLSALQSQVENTALRAVMEHTIAHLRETHP